MSNFWGPFFSLFMVKKKLFENTIAEKLHIPFFYKNKNFDPEKLKKKVFLGLKIRV